MEENTLANKPKPSSWRQRLPLLMIVAAFIFPALTAFLLLRFNGWQQLSHTQKGMLIRTPTQLQSIFSDKNFNRNKSLPTTIKPTWKIMYFVDSHCSGSCQLTLMQLRQTHKALGVDQSRVEPWILPLRSPDNEFQALIDSTFPDIKVTGLITPEEIHWFLQTPAHAQKSDIHQWVWIVDPLGQVVTAYPTHSDMNTAILAGKNLLKDLKHLLKLSRVG